MKLFLALGAGSAALSVMLGAFAAHGLKKTLPEAMLQVFQIGVQYQFYHSLGLLLIAILIKQLDDALLMWSGSLMALGIVFFSGSLYLLALTGMKWLGPITPLGGVCFIASWIILLVSALRSGA